MLGRGPSSLDSQPYQRIFFQKAKLLGMTDTWPTGANFKRALLATAHEYYRSLF
jgi:hypothetical protein